MYLGIAVPGGTIVVDTDLAVCPHVLPILINQVLDTGKVPVLPDGVKVQFKRLR